MGEEAAVATATMLPPRTTPKAEKPVKDDDTVPEDNETTGAANNKKESTATTTPKNNKKLLNLRFLFANRDGLSVSIQCDPTNTVGQVKGTLISMWPKEMPACSDGDDLRLICMGKGFLTPDECTLEELQIPSFKAHATPINVSVKRSEPAALSKHQQQPSQKSASNVTTAANALSTPAATGPQGCGCVIQ